MEIGKRRFSRFLLRQARLFPTDIQASPKSRRKVYILPSAMALLTTTIQYGLQSKKHLTHTTAIRKRPLPSRNNQREHASDIEQIDATHYFIGTDVGVLLRRVETTYCAILRKSCEKLDTLRLQINELFLSKGSQNSSSELSKGV